MGAMREDGSVNVYLTNPGDVGSGPGGSGTEYTEDAASAANPVGGALILRRRDVLSATEVSAENDNIAANATSKGELYVKQTDAVPVTDNGGNLSIDDGGNSITVDGTVAVSGTVAVTDNAGSLTVDNAGTFAVQATIAAGATAIAKAEDVASADADVGVPALAVRKATPANTSGTDGDYEFLQMSEGRLWVDPSGVTLTVASHAVTNAGTFATQAAITAASGSIASGAFASGSVASGAFASGSIAAGAVAAGASSFVKLEDVGSADADAGVPAMAVRKATPANTSGTDGDYEFLQMSAGRLWVDPSGVTLTVASHAVTNAGTFAVQAAGDVAHDGVDSGSPVKIGGYAITALPTAVANQDRTNFVADKFGRQVALPITVRDLVGTQTTTISASTSETTIVTAAASTFNDLVMLIVSNTSASTNTRIDFRDTTAGSVLFSLQSVGGAAPVGFALPVPIPQTSVNTNWTAQCATSTTDVRIYAVFAKNK